MRISIFILVFLSLSCASTKKKKFQINEDVWNIDPKKKVLYMQERGRMKTMRLSDYNARGMVCIDEAYFEDLTTFRDY